MESMYQVLFLSCNLKGLWVETKILNQSRKVTIFNICEKLQSHTANAIAITIVTRL